MPRRYPVLAVLMAAVMSAPPAAAQSRGTLVPSLSLGAVYDDNVTARARGDAGRMLQLRPSLEADWESPKVTFISLWSFDAQRSNHEALNTLDARRHAMVDMKVRPTQATTVALVSRYDRSNMPGDLNVDSGIFSRRQDAHRWQVTPGLTHRAGLRTTLSASYDWIRENLVGDPLFFIPDTTGTLQTARASVSRQTSTRSTFSLGYLGRLFTDELDEHQSHAVLAGYSLEFAPRTILTLQAGPRRTTYRGLQPEVLVGLARTGHRLIVGIDYWHGETIILGVHGPVAIDTGNARATWTATRRLELGLRGGVSQIETLDLRAATIYRASLLGSWSIGGPFTLTTSYDADYQLGDIRRSFFADDKVLRHVVRVGVTIAPSFSRSFLPSDEAARAKGVSR